MAFPTAEGHLEHGERRDKGRLPFVSGSVPSSHFPAQEKLLNLPGGLGRERMI